MKTLTSIVLIFVPFLALTEELPTDASEILKKLEVFEKSELQKANDQIAEKRRSVIEFLQTIMDRETRNGNLDGAIAIKKQIGLLTPTSSTVDAPAVEEIVDESWFVGKTWANRIVEFQFRADGVGTKKLLVGEQQGRDFPMKWRVHESGSIEIDHVGVKAYIWPKTSRRAEISQTTDPKNSREEIELK